MIVCITEKPSVARDIAVILGASKRCDGYYEGSGYCVTWTFGHLCTLKEPADYTDSWKRWSLGALPMIPERFGIKLIDQPSIKRQFKVIETLVSQADKVINCGDAGQEGELIQRWVMQKASVDCPVERLWISSLTDESIREGFNHLEPQDRYDNLYLAGLSRAIGDWVLGLNATRLYSLKYGQGGDVLSIGRVQTPTLALVVQRHHEIENFVPRDSWELRTTYRDTVFTSTLKPFEHEEQARQMAASIAPLPLRITDVTAKDGREAPLRLFDLTSLQVECNRRWGWSADTSLKLIQSLYEKKVTTYPRVDTTYLSDDMHPKIAGIMQHMTPYADRTAPVLAKPIPKPKRIFDNSKVTDHHAIIPTGQSPTSLVGDERKLYHLIALRFIAAFYPDCRFTQTTVTAVAGDVGFRVGGKAITDPGWRSIYGADTADNQSTDGDADDKERTLPQFVVGESGPHKPSVAKRTTQPPKPYTEGTLLRAMEGAGRSVDDEELREALKENGIGRPSTRAAIIETLFKRRYLLRRRKSIVPTQAGIDLIATIGEELLKSAKLTGLWENKLRRIERGQYSPAEFIGEIKAMIGQIVVNVLNDNTHQRIIAGQHDKPAKKVAASSQAAAKSDARTKPRTQRITRLEQIVCPICGQGHMIKGRTAYGCSRYGEGCPMRLPFTEYPADLTPARLARAMSKSSKK